MRKRRIPIYINPNVYERALTVLEAWKIYSGVLIVPKLTIQKFEQKVEEAKRTIDIAEKVQRARSEAVYERDKALSELWQRVKWIQNVAKATFGSESEEISRFVRQAVRFKKLSPDKLEQPDASNTE
ncbi:hypothetical protein JXJ21_15400 [candidate division KSB1 bacterium]|nr:hypothetical protein [candidate division KSB1 bacterium]